MDRLSGPRSSCFRGRGRRCSSPPSPSSVGVVVGVVSAVGVVLVGEVDVVSAWVRAGVASVVDAVGATSLSTPPPLPSALPSEPLAMSPSSAPVARHVSPSTLPSSSSFPTQVLA